MDLTADAINVLLTRLDKSAVGLALQDGREAVIIPAGHKVEMVNPLTPILSNRIAATVLMHDQASFIAYINRYKTEATQLFAEPGFLSGGTAKMQAVMDYHRAAANGTGEKTDKDSKSTNANYTAHVANFVPRYSEAWTRWQAATKEPMEQAELAEFIEENRADIVDPSAAQMLDIVRTFKVKKDSEYDSLTYQADGAVKLHYSERVQQQGSTLFPEKLAIGIPVYFRGEVFKVGVFARFKLGGGKVRFQLKLDRDDVIEDEAFKAMIETVTGAVGIGAYLGRRA
jgi:uncharacterized protein YfdQ (DUF2303 family)